MTRQPKFFGQRVKENTECGEHVGTDELAYVVEATRHIEAAERGFGEAYRDGQLGLELDFRAVNDEFSGQFREDSTVLYGFRGLIGPEHPTALVNKFPRERTIEGGNRQHMVLVAIRELMQMDQRVSGPSLRLHSIGLKPFNQANGLVMDSEDAPFLQFAAEIFGGLADRKLVHEAGCLTFAFDKFLDDVVQRGPKIMDDITGNRGEFERWLMDNIESEPTACAVVGIALGKDRSVRSTVQVRKGFSLEPVKVVIGIP